jgi:hypothetical protein
MWPRLLSLLTTLPWVLAFALVEESGKLTLTIHSGDDEEPVPCRIHLKDSAGKAQRAPNLPFWFDHFVCPGTVSLELPHGEYHYEIERGPEYATITGAVTIRPGAGEKRTHSLQRLIDMRSEGWWPGELHVHRPVSDIELLMKAEDLHVAPVITWWNNRNPWAQQKPPSRSLVRFDGNRYYDVLAGEDEREGGALLYFHLPQPLPIAGAAREFPSPMKFVEQAREYPKVWIDIEKPFWWDMPVWVASGEMDSIGIANNHMCRDRMYESEAWGKPRVVERYPPPRGTGFWSQEIYYHLLNCGIRLPPSAGSASGVLPNPVGHNRVYVHLGKELNYDLWWQGLKAGRSVVTNGPLLRVEAAGQLPGHVFQSMGDKELQIDLRAKLTSREPVRFIEIVKDGVVEQRMPSETVATGQLGRLTFKTSGWFLVRAIADNDKTFRFASTAPYYVEVGSSPRRISKASAQFFLDWVQERIQRVKVDDPAQRQEVLRYHQKAEEFWKEKVAKANAP